MRGISLGLGFTNACDRACPHCYRPPGPPQHQTLADVEHALAVFEVGGVNFGTGENVLNPHLPSALDLLHARGVPASLTSNGLSLRELDETRLRRLHDVEVSFDFATREELDRFRGEGAWDSAVGAVRRCVALGLDVTVLAVMMAENWNRLGDIARLAAELGAGFRVNVYQPVYGRERMPSFAQFWEGFRLLFAAAEVVTCTEPVVAALLAEEAGEGPESRAGGCGRASARITPTLGVLPCVYWPRAAGTLGALAPGSGSAVFEHPEFEACRTVPEACRDCRLVARCGGGCASRRALTVGIAERDPYCPLRAPELPRLDARVGTRKALLHAANVCTTLVRVC